MSKKMIMLLLNGTLDTLIMTFVSGFLGFLLGLPIGILLYLSRPGQFMEKLILYRIISALVNMFRSIPFIILLVWIIPLTQLIVGTSIGIYGAIVPLTISATPFIARMVENTLLEIPNAFIEAARSMGATPLQIIGKILLPESLPGLINAATITLTMLVGYSVMGGAVGSGGLGQIAMQYGYYSYNPIVMNIVLALLIMLVFGIQFIGNHLMIMKNYK